VPITLPHATDTRIPDLHGATTGASTEIGVPAFIARLNDASEHWLPRTYAVDIRAMFEKLIGAKKRRSRTTRPHRQRHETFRLPEHRHRERRHRVIRAVLGVAGDGDDPEPPRLPPPPELAEVVRRQEIAKAVFEILPRFADDPVALEQLHLIVEKLRRPGGRS
jgi:hypothetical protein